MTQYIDKSALVAEIERRRSKNARNKLNLAASFEDNYLLSFLDTLEVKEVQEPTASDRGIAEEIIINLKRVEQDYHIDLTREMEWLRNLTKKGEPVSRTPADIEAAMQEVEEKSKAFTEAHQGEGTDTILAQMRGEEPVSNELNSFAEEYSFNIPSDIYNLLPKEKQALWIIEIENAIKAGAKWQKANLWKPADGDDLPEIDMEVIVLQGIKNPVTTDSMWGCEVAFAHRPNPDGWDGKSILTGEVRHYDVQTYDKGGWNIPDVKYWLDCEIPNAD